MSKTISVQFFMISELGIFMNNLSSYCGLVDAKIRASDKDLSVPELAKSLAENVWKDFEEHSSWLD